MERRGTTPITNPKLLLEWTSKETENDAAVTMNDLKRHLNEQKRKRAAEKGFDVQSVRPVGKTTVWRWKQVAYGRHMRIYFRPVIGFRVVGSEGVSTKTSILYSSPARSS